jgi:hypothetical protein
MTNRKGADDPLASARDLLRRDIMPLPVPCGKNPNRRNWQNYTITEANVEQYFNGADLNVGGRMGPKSNGLTDVDLDCTEALTLSKYFLPKTPARYGRHSKPESHHLYRCDDVDPKAKATIQFRDENQEVIVELRLGVSAGAQSIMPASRHLKTGELIEWDEDGDPIKVEFGALKTAVTRLAFASLLLRHWPETGCHDLALGIGGFLARAEWPEEAIHHFVETLCLYRHLPDATDVDERAARHAHDAASAVARLKEGEDTRGLPWLKATLGDKVAKALAKIVGYRSREAPPPPQVSGDGRPLIQVVPGELSRAAKPAGVGWTDAPRHGSRWTSPTTWAAPCWGGAESGTSRPWSASR